MPEGKSYANQASSYDSVDSCKHAGAGGRPGSIFKTGSAGPAACPGVGGRTRSREPHSPEFGSVDYPQWLLVCPWSLWAQRITYAESAQLKAKLKGLISGGETAV